ncbi:hypothetical protein OAS39_01530 [Pirellulales bacterium]|nr:hypothetical protein [Pirellulales bacterium]
MRRQHAKWYYVLAAIVGMAGCAAAPKPPTPAAPDFASALESLSNADSALVSINSPGQCCPKQNLPQFLGLECIGRGVLGLFDRIRNRLGMAFPGLEATPPLLAITDPANMTDDAPPAVKAAAEIKAEEDQAAQKIKALRYLATIGCGGCYPDVEDALIAAMEDCTEEVRYEAVRAVRATTGKRCCYCSCDSCCSEKIQNKLRELSNGQGCPCCIGEQSARVRRNARLALNACGPPVVYEEEEPEPEPEDIEGPQEGPAEGPEGEGADEGPVEELEPPADSVADGTDRNPTGPVIRAASAPATVTPPPARYSVRPEPLPPVTAK